MVACLTKNPKEIAKSNNCGKYDKHFLQSFSNISIRLLMLSAKMKLSVEIPSRSIYSSVKLMGVARFV